MSLLQLLTWRELSTKARKVPCCGLEPCALLYVVCIVYYSLPARSPGLPRTSIAHRHSPLPNKLCRVGDYLPVYPGVISAKSEFVDIAKGINIHFA